MDMAPNNRAYIGESLAIDMSNSCHVLAHTVSFNLIPKPLLSVETMYIRFACYLFENSANERACQLIIQNAKKSQSTIFLNFHSIIILLIPTCEKTFLISLFTINGYSYFIEILQFDRKNCNLGCLNDL